MKINRITFLIALYSAACVASEGTMCRVLVLSDVEPALSEGKSHKVYQSEKLICRESFSWVRSIMKKVYPAAELKIFDCSLNETALLFHGSDPNRISSSVIIQALAHLGAIEKNPDETSYRIVKLPPPIPF